MATPFRLKRSAIEGKRPAESDLQRGELALNTYDGYLYTEREGVGLATVTNLTPWYENYGGGSIYYSNSVGIGTTVPQYKLDVRKGSIGGYDALRAPHSDVIVEIEVKVISKTEDHRYKGTGSGLGYTLDGVESPFLTLVPGRTYRFKQDDSSNGSHPIAFYLTADKATQYTGGVTTNGSAGSSGAYTQIVVGDETPTVLHYQCVNHGYMGNAVEVNSNVVNSNYAAILRNGLDVTSGNVDITQNLNVTGNLDVDGATTLDGTTIDGLLDINAGGQANTFKVEDLTSGRVVIVGTGGELEDSGNLLFNGTDLSAASLIVSDLTSGRVVLAGGSGAVEDNANLKFNTTTSEFEVVGHTVLDTVVASGIVTASSGLNVTGTITGNNLTLSDNDPELTFTDLNNNPDYRIKAESGNLSFEDTTNGNVVRLRINANGHVDVTGNLDVGAGIDVTGDATISNNATISGDLTVTGNVGIAGTLTYEDVSRVDAVGLSTFREGLFIPDNQKAQFGNAAGSADLEIYHDGSHSYIHDGGTGNLKVRSNNFRVSNADESKLSATFVPSGAVELYHNNSKKLETYNQGVSVSGNLVATGGITANTNIFIENIFPQLFFVDTNNNSDFALQNLNGTFVVKDTTNSANRLVVDSAGKIGIATLTPTSILHVVGDSLVTGVTTSTGGFVGNLTGNVTGTATLATDLAINGTNQIVYQDSNNDSDVLPTGNAGQILASSGAGAAPQWVNSAPAGAIEGITIRDESTIVGTANSISTINFIGSVVTADAAAGAGIATVTIDALSGVLVKEDEANVGTAITAFDFSGSLVDVDAASNSGIATVQIDGLTVKDEGSSVGTAGSITSINFVGAGIAAAASGDTATVTVAGGVSNADVVALAIALG